MSNPPGHCRREVVWGSCECAPEAKVGCGHFRAAPPTPVQSPAAYQYLFDGPYGEVWLNSPTGRNGAQPKAWRELVVQKPEWRTVPHGNLVYFGTLGDLWLAMVTGEVVVGRYHWEQGHDPEGFQTMELGRVRAKDVSHFMPYARPAHPGVPS